MNAITDRDTFVNMFDSEAALKDGASDLGFDLDYGGLTAQARVRARRYVLENRKSYV